MPDLSYIYWIKCCIWNFKTELGLKVRSWRAVRVWREWVKSPTGISATEGFSHPKSADSPLPTQGLKFRKAGKTVQEQYERKQQTEKTEVQAAELKTKDTPSLYLLHSSLRELGNNRVFCLPSALVNFLKFYKDCCIFYENTHKPLGLVHTNKVSFLNPDFSSSISHHYQPWPSRYTRWAACVWATHFNELLFC